jgi:hypothetical protein
MDLTVKRKKSKVGGESKRQERTGVSGSGRYYESDITFSYNGEFDPGSG